MQLLGKLFLTIVLLLGAVGTAFATDITVGGFTIANSHGYTGTSIKLRIYYSGCLGTNFITSDSQVVFCGAVGASTGFYKEVSVTVNSSTGTLTIPAFVIPSTDDASPPTVRAHGVFFVSGARRDTLFTNWVITNTLGASVTYAALAAYQPNVLPNPPPATYLTAAQISALIAASVPTVAKATTTTEGVVRVSNPPVDSAHPIAREFNDTVNPLTVTKTGQTGGGITGVTSSITGTDATVGGLVYTGGNFTGANSTATNIGDHNVTRGIRASGIFSGTGRNDSGMGLDVSVNNSGTGALEDAYIVYGQAQNLGNGAMGHAHGIYSDIVLSGTSYLTSGAVLFEGKYRQLGSGNSPEVAGLKLYGWTKGTSTVTTSYGIYMDSSIDIGATRWAIFSASTSPSILGGTLQIAGGMVASGAGTTNTIPRYVNGATAALGNSQITDDLTTVSIANTGSTKQVFIGNGDSSVISIGQSSEGSVSIGGPDGAGVRVANGQVILGDISAVSANSLLIVENGQVTTNVPISPATAGGTTLGTSSVPFSSIYIGASGNTLQLTGTGTADRTATFPDATTKLPIATQFLTFTGPTASRTITLPDSNTSVPSATQIITFSGLTAPRTLTLYDANFTVARTNDINTFTNRQTFATDILVSAATANLYLKDTSTGFQSASSTVITPQANNAFRSPSYTNGLVGWNISATGSAEFDNVDVRGAIHAGVITYNALLATSGTLGVFKSAAKLRTDAVVPAGPTYGTTNINIDVVDQDGLSHPASQLFIVNDILRLKDGLVGDTWFRVFSVSDQGTFWRYAATIMAGTNSVTYRTALGVADYGQPNAGFIILTADQTNAPYQQMATHAGTFTSADASGSLIVTPQTRIGNLNGSFGYVSDIYGFSAGQYGAASKEWITVDQTNGIRIGNNTTVLGQWNTAGDITVGQVSAGQSNTLISAGALSIRTNTTSLFNVNTAGSLRIGTDTSAAATTNLLVVNANGLYNGESVVVGDILIGDNTTASNFGNIKISGGTISIRRGTTTHIALSATDAQFTNLIKMSGASAAISLGTTPPTSASAGTGVWLDRTGLYGLLTNVVQAKLDATTGAITAGAGNVTLDVNGIWLKNDGAGSVAAQGVTWAVSAGGTRTGYLVNYRNSTEASTQLYSTIQSGGDASDYATAQVVAAGDTGNDVRLQMWKQGTTAARANIGLIIATGVGGSFSGFQVGGTGTTFRATTEGTNRLDIFDGTAPVGTLANGISLYSTAGELRVMDAAGNATLLSPHDLLTNEWIFYSKNTVTGKVLRIDMERLMRALDAKLGGGFIKEYIEP